MCLALREARKGIGRTSPNPCVGSVIVKNDRIISKGYHKKAGDAHAEINALRKAGEEARGATVYVTLEPCNHTGRTPPCSQALERAGVKRVVVGMEDPNPLVHGSGIAYLADRGIEVLSGVLAKECRVINRPFLKHITTALPWIVMKAGISLDGKITYQKGKSGWITGPETMKMVHRLRDISDAIMVGVDTVCIDNPSLTTRLPKKKGKDPIRIIVDSHLRIPLSAKLLRLESTAKTWVFCSTDADREAQKHLVDAGALVHRVGGDGTGRLNLKQVLKTLGREGITSVLVEGGAKIHGSLLKNRQVDHVNLFYAPLFAGDGGISVVDGLTSSSREEAICLEEVHYKRFGNDLMIEGDVYYR